MQYQTFNGLVKHQTRLKSLAGLAEQHSLI